MILNHGPMICLCTITGDHQCQRRCGIAAHLSSGNHHTLLYQPKGPDGGEPSGAVKCWQLLWHHQLHVRMRVIGPSCPALRLSPARVHGAADRSLHHHGHPSHYLCHPVQERQQRQADRCQAVHRCVLRSAPSLKFPVVQLHLHPAPAVSFTAVQRNT